ncbi:M56 family metallopeptidase [Clostridium scatologenes]|uniref:Peptidase M56, BlaR1 n=1 Tax=Clostridium scatologenes TaxID=1548 RepID=A0A0E3JXZ9_CLOSL|nr:M56 family metallopeptidase [Clostridium scatologenes]AKA68474.1 peptidase M56, BlaR1 [Clostridium scatologenes]
MVSLFFYNYILFNWVVQLSVSASILTVLVIMIQKLIKNRFGAKFQYIIWFAVIVRLVLPQLPTSSISIFNYVPSVKQMPPIIVVEKSTKNEKKISVEPRINSAYSKYSEPYNEIDLNNLLNLSYITKNIPLNPDISFFLSLIWIIGVFVIGIYKLSICIYFQNKIRKKDDFCDIEVINILEKCKSEMKVNKYIKLVETEKVKSPSLIGVIHPIILLPKNIHEIVPMRKLNYIFIHELAHLKQKDTFINWIILVLGILHWFNPVIHYSFSKMCEDMEISCDSLALSYINDDEAKEYGLTILSLAEKISIHTNLPVMASIVSSKSKIKRRIIMIKMFNKKSHKVSAVAMASLLVLGCAVLTDGNAKASSIKNQIVSNFSKHQDKVDYPFVNDAQLIGRWQSVDFVKNISDFKVDSKSWSGNLFVKELNFLQDGKVSKTAFTWTKGIILDQAQKTASKYVIKEINGSTYMFFEWKNGDYTMRGMKPNYYVMKKVNSVPLLTTNMHGEEVGNRKVDKIEYSFVNDSQVIGNWKSVDFVKNTSDFKPGNQSWQSELFLNTLNFAKDGSLNSRFYNDGKILDLKLTWTKDIVIDKNNKTASRYIIKEINGSTYMFYEWKSGDYTDRGMKPYYYVLEKTN